MHGTRSMPSGWHEGGTWIPVRAWRRCRGLILLLHASAMLGTACDDPTPTQPKASVGLPLRGSKTLWDEPTDSREVPVAPSSTATAPAEGPKAEIAAAEAKPEQAAVVADSGLRVREMPFAGAPVTAVLAFGDMVTVGVSFGGWRSVHAANGTGGWVSEKYLAASWRSEQPSLAGGPGEAACSCDFHVEACETSCRGCSSPCTCDVDCRLPSGSYDRACVEDRHCDSWCPLGLDPDCESSVSDAGVDSSFDSVLRSFTDRNRKQKEFEASLLRHIQRPPPQQPVHHGSGYWQMGTIKTRFDRPSAYDQPTVYPR